MSYHEVIFGEQRTQFGQLYSNGPITGVVHDQIKEFDYGHS